MKIEKVKFYRYFSFSPRCVTHQVAVPLQARHNCNVIMNNLYTWKAHSKIYWNNSETITLTVYLMEWSRVTQYHTQRHRYHFWLIGLKNQWGYLIKKQVCLWTHFKQSKCSTTTTPTTPKHHPPQLPSTTPKPTINNGIKRSLFLLQPYTYSKTSHFPPYLININSDFFQTFTTGFYFAGWSK